MVPDPFGVSACVLGRREMIGCLAAPDSSRGCEDSAAGADHGDGEDNLDDRMRGPGGRPKKALSHRGGKGGQVGEGQGAQHDQAGGHGQRRALPREWAARP